MLAIMFSSGKLTIFVLNSFLAQKAVKFAEMDLIFMRNSYQQMVSTSKFTQLVQIMHMLKHESVHLLMESCKEMKMEKKFGTQSTSHNRKKILPGK